MGLRWCAPLLFLLSAALLPAHAKVVEYPAPLGGAGAPALDKRAIVIIYSTTDIEAAEPLIAGFQGIHPEVSVTYHDLNSIELYDRFIAEVRNGKPSADLLLSSAMDLQIKLVNDSYAMAYDSREAAKLPAWAVWRNEAFGFTFEPVVIAYNKDLVPPEDVPETRYDLAQLLRGKPEVYFGKVATYDIERSGAGFLFATQDAKQSQAIWDLARSLGSSGVKLYTSTAAILDRISEGKFLIGYNLLGSYALARSRNDPSIAIVLPRDYTLIMSRIAMIPKSAAHPRSAKLFLDFLLSERGQRIVAGQSLLYSIHPDVTGEVTAEALRSTSGTLRPIQVGPGLLVYLDQVKRRKFLQRWERSLGGR